jgi:hypothetical protein
VLFAPSILRVCTIPYYKYSAIFASYCISIIVILVGVGVAWLIDIPE